MVDWSAEDCPLGLNILRLRDKERWVSEKRMRSKRRRESLCGEAIDGKLLGGERERERPWSDLSEGEGVSWY